MPLRDVVRPFSVPCCFGIGSAIARPVIEHFLLMFPRLMIHPGAQTLKLEAAADVSLGYDVTLTPSAATA